MPGAFEIIDRTILAPNEVYFCCQYCPAKFQRREQDDHILTGLYGCMVALAIFDESEAAIDQLIRAGSATEQLEIRRNIVPKALARSAPYLPKDFDCIRHYDRPTPLE